MTGAEETHNFSLYRMHKLGDGFPILRNDLAWEEGRGKRGDERGKRPSDASQLGSGTMLRSSDLLRPSYIQEA